MSIYDGHRILRHVQCQLRPQHIVAAICLFDSHVRLAESIFFFEVSCEGETVVACSAERVAYHFECCEGGLHGIFAVAWRYLPFNPRGKATLIELDLRSQPDSGKRLLLFSFVAFRKCDIGEDEHHEQRKPKYMRGAPRFH